LSAVGDIEGMSPYVPAFAHEYQLRLKQARVGIFGLGRLGAQLGRMLALVGVGHILGVDHESVQLQDTFADSGYSAVHIGRPRAEAEGEIITSTNPFVAYSASCETPETVPQYADLLRSCTFAILCRDYQQPGEYELFNLAALETDTPWISCRAIGFEFDYGPCVLPRKTPCYKCFDLRQKSNLPDYEAYVLEENLLNTHQIGLVSLAITPGLSLVALEVVKAITNFMQPATLAHVCSYNILTGELARHPILKIPRCPHCGRPSQNRPTIQAWQQSDIP
jgi:bacteriocin biosynthesis cyclodehydratase domain-containing protein